MSEDVFPSYGKRGYSPAIAVRSFARGLVNLLNINLPETNSLHLKTWMVGIRPIFSRGELSCSFQGQRGFFAFRSVSLTFHSCNVAARFTTEIPHSMVSSPMARPQRRLLSNALSGNSRTSMIGTLSPAVS